MFLLRLFILGICVAVGLVMGTIPVEQTNNFAKFMSFSLLITVPWLYMLPTVEANSLNHPNLSSIAILNLFLGWTLLGWVVAAVWAFKKPEPVNIVQEPIKEKEPVIQAQDTKICPFCAEEIKFKAIVCKHCGKDQPVEVDKQ